MSIAATLQAARREGPYAAAPTAVSTVAGKGKVDLTPDGAEVRDVVVDAPIVDDWTPVFALFKLDASVFEVVDDTVRMSTWQQSKATDDGQRDVVQLYSYSARFRRRPEGLLPAADVEAHMARMRDWRLPRRIRRTSGARTDGPEVTAVVNLADIQGGKAEGGNTGVAATLQRLTDGLENTQRWLDRQRLDHNITEVFLVNNGDPIEGCDGNYANQLFKVELDTRGQMNFALDAWELYARTLFPQFEKARFVSVLCNHGEFGRMGGPKNRTGDADNAGGFLAETLQRIMRERAEFDHVQWTIPHDEMNVYATTAGGIRMGFNHGHKIAGNDAGGFEKWLNGQVRGDDLAYAVQVWVTAHRHHFACWDLGSCSAFQCPSLDGGSKWLRDMTGRFSRSGVLAFLVNPADPLGWSDFAFL
ncbi:hypothetical protein GS982_19915 [Rhodococcus hoagii]|nr:hypothetical protein [Prescottella equi]NKZ84470.1 hypothetical protein [Prescottella equi]